MCGRFALTLPQDAVASWFKADVRAEFIGLRYNVCPSQNVQSIVSFDGARIIVSMRWGFIPHWYKAANDGPMLINARGETISEKPAFKSAIASRRCIIPASGFYEWQAKDEGSKQPWYIRNSADDILGFGGIWQAWTAPDGARQVTCAIVTTQANNQMSEIHHREPVVVSKSEMDVWLSPDSIDASTLIEAKGDGFFTMHKVSSSVNSARVDAANLIEPIVD